MTDQNYQRYFVDLQKNDSQIIFGRCRFEIKDFNLNVHVWLKNLEQGFYDFYIVTEDNSIKIKTIETDKFKTAQFDADFIKDNILDSKIDIKNLKAIVITSRNNKNSIILSGEKNKNVESNWKQNFVNKKSIEKDTSENNNTSEEIISKNKIKNTIELKKFKMLSNNKLIDNNKKNIKYFKIKHDDIFLNNKSNSQKYDSKTPSDIELAKKNTLNIKNNLDINVTNEIKENTWKRTTLNNDLKSYSKKDKQNINTKKIKEDKKENKDIDNNKFYEQKCSEKKLEIRNFNLKKNTNEKEINYKKIKKNNEINNIDFIFKYNPEFIFCEDQKNPENLNLSGVKWHKLFIYELVLFELDYFFISHNPFLLCNYFKYNHFILGCHEENFEKKFIIGMPGKFDRRNKLLAKKIGFEEFKNYNNKEKEFNENFGYWIKKVNSKKNFIF
ncbi:MAG: hypothetical protein LBJ93_02230 [Clostridiales bacterium]|jgi:hypothetical protein|nr:hypothetical protein [Clostridiales bacterium]